MRISCPPHISGCYYGIDFPTKKELIAANHSLEEIRKFLGVDTLAYLSLEGLMACIGERDRFCYACFTGKYPVPLKQKISKMITEERC